MRSTRKIFAAMAFATAMMAFGGSSQAAPLGDMTPLPNLAPLSAQDQAQPAHCRRYRHCHTRCHRWKWKRRCYRSCHRC
jgi:hypothetical protein